MKKYPVSKFHSHSMHPSPPPPPKFSSMEISMNTMLYMFKSSCSALVMKLTEVVTYRRLSCILHAHTHVCAHKLHDMCTNTHTHTQWHTNTYRAKHTHIHTHTHTHTSTYIQSKKHTHTHSNVHMDQQTVPPFLTLSTVRPADDLKHAFQLVVEVLQFTQVRLRGL